MNKIKYIVFFLCCLLSYKSIGQNTSSNRLTKIAKKAPDSIGNFTFNIVDYFKTITVDKKELVLLFNYWIYENISYDISKYLSNDSNYTNVRETLDSKKTMCQGYSELLSELCFWADIECEIINGYAKGVDFDGKPFKNTNHIWNAVLIDNKWELVDITWAIGNIKYKKDQLVFLKKLRDEYVFAKPDIFILTHFPVNPKWQLLLSPIKYDEFLNNMKKKERKNKGERDRSIQYIRFRPLF